MMKNIYHMNHRSIAAKIACGLGAILTLAAAYLFVPPPHDASAQFADQGAYGGTSGGSANAQTIAIANLSANKPGIILRFIPSFTNTGPTQINVSGIGFVNVLRPSSIGLVAFSSGEFQAGEMTCITYNNVASAYQLACNVDMTRIGEAIDLRQSGGTAPRGTLIEDGSCVSQTTYAPLFSVIGTTYNAGAPVACTGSTFALPFSNGTAFMALDGQGSNGLAGRITTTTCATPNAVGLCGSQTYTIVTSNLPPYTPSGSIANGAITSTTNATLINFNGSQAGGGGAAGTSAGGATVISTQAGSTFSGNAQGGTSTPHTILNPVLLGRRAIKY